MIALMVLGPGDKFLAMTFLSPGFLAAGCALAAVPIVIHLLNRRRFRVVPWAAMEFLLAAIRKNRRRLRFESWLLLAVRCAALLLLGFALARPMGCENASLASLGQRAGLDVFIIDNSYSMGYRFVRGVAKTHLDQAKIIAHTMISRLEGGGDGIVLLTAAAPAGEIIGQPTYDLAAANRAVENIAQTAAATDLAGAMRDALSVAQRNASFPNKHLFILTDSTRSALENSASGDLRTIAADLARQYSITYFGLGRESQRNVAVSNLHATDRLLTTKFPTQLQTDLRGFDVTSPTTLQWRLDGQLIGTTEASPSTTGTAAMLDHVAFPSGGAHVLGVTATGDDSLSIDNTCYRVANIASQLKALLVEGDRGSGPMGGSAGFLNIALAPAQSPGKMSDSYIQPTTISDLQLGSEVLGDYHAIVLANVPTLDATEAEALQRYVSTGGTLMIFMGELVNADNYNQMLLPRGLLPGALQRRMVAPADSPYHFDFHSNAPLHAILQFLSNQPRSGLETAEVGSYWQVNLPGNSKVERVLEFKNEKKSLPDSSLSVDPAITLQTLGSGRVLFFSTTADAQWTTLPAKPVYVPLMHELLRGAIVPDDLWMNLTVGQRLALPERIKLTAAPVLNMPDGQKMALQLTEATPAVYQSSVLSRPGVYTLNVGSDTYPIAVNPPTEEADVRTESVSAVRAIFGDVPMEIEGDQPPVEKTNENQGRDFGWLAMLAVLGLLGNECFMAMRFGHYKKLNH
jgi:Aerotolerance regulator N-terminal/von Willebrand factor type A domain